MPKSSMKADEQLDALRREIDAIDSSIHDLLMQRTDVVEKVRDLKRPYRIKIRPAREAEILYRLVSEHKGPFPKRELVRMWRELIVATLSMEGPFSVAVHMPEDGSGLWDLARDQYGSFTPMTAHVSARRVIEAVRSQQATVGVLPLPRRDDSDPWWRHLAAEDRDAPRIIARLPFTGPGGGMGAEALAICPVAQEPTGRDCTYVAIEAKEQIGLARLGSALEGAGLPCAYTASWHDDEEPGRWLYLAEVTVYLAPDDRRIKRLLEDIALAGARSIHLGGYAKPLEPWELEVEASRGLSKAADKTARKGKAAKTRKTSP